MKGDRGGRQHRREPAPGDRARAQDGRRRSAWTRVLHDVFPILSDPRALTRPFLQRDRRKD